MSLQAAALARRDPAVALEATLLMVRTYLQPLVDALWAGEATDASDVISVVSTCDHLLYSLDATERTSTRWLVRPALHRGCERSHCRGCHLRWIRNDLRSNYACVCVRSLLSCACLCLVVAHI